MKNHDIDFGTLGRRIQEVLYEYVRIQSYTNTEKERLVEGFFTGLFGNLAYFREHPECWGLYPVEDDPLERNVCRAMVKGKGSKTVVLVHHYDIVDIEDFKTLKPFAFSPERLGEELAKHPDLLTEDARRDLFGRHRGKDDAFRLCARLSVPRGEGL